MAVVTMRQLLESGVHFGHQTRRWNPKMKRFIMTERNGIYIIDLQQSLAYIDRGYAFIKGAVASGGNVLFVGTKKQAQQAISEQAKRVGMPYVNQRWLGGMLTNFQTVHQRLQRLKELEEINFDDVAGSSRTKKELLQMRREKDKLDRTLGGIRDMGRVPAAVWIVDTNKEHLAVDEARKLGIPIVAILDSNCDPDVVDFPIPGNDDAIRSVALLTRVVADAVAEGLMARAGVKTGTEATGEELGREEPLAQWERELLEGQADKAAGEQAGADTAAVSTPAAESTGVSSEASSAATSGTASTETAAAASADPGGASTETAAAASADPGGASTETTAATSADTDTATDTETDAATSEAMAPDEEVVTTGGEPVPAEPAVDGDAADADVTTTGGEPVPAESGDAADATAEGDDTTKS